MYINKYVGMALLGVMACVLGVLVFMMVNDAPPAQAQKSTQSDVQVVRLQLMANSDGLAILDNNGRMVIYKISNGNLYPMAGRIIRYDFEVLDKTTSMSYSNPSGSDKYEPVNLKKLVESGN